MNSGGMFVMKHGEWNDHAPQDIRVVSFQV